MPRLLACGLVAATLVAYSPRPAASAPPMQVCSGAVTVSNISLADVVRDTMSVSATVTSLCVIQSVTLKIPTFPDVAMTKGSGTTWSTGTFSVLALAPGPHVATVVATDVGATSGSASQSFSHDPLPVVTFEPPPSGTVARPTVRVRASCQDEDPRGCRFLTLLIRTATGVPMTVLQVSQSFDQDVSLAGFEGADMYLNVWAEDFGGGVSSSDYALVYVEPSPWMVTDLQLPGNGLMVIPRPRPLILADTPTHTLFVDSDSAVRLRNKSTGTAEVIVSATDTTPCGQITPFGALVAARPPFGGSGIYEWRNGTLVSHGPTSSTCSLRVAGSFAAWIDGGPGRIILEDLTTGSTAIIEPLNYIAHEIDLASNGDVVSTGDRGESLVRLYRSGTTTTLDRGDEAITDGINVAYYSICISFGCSSRQLFLRTSGGTLTLATAAPFPRGVLLSNGWALYAVTSGGDTNVWLRSPLGTVTQLTAFTGTTVPAALDGEGRAAVMRNGRLYIVQPGQPPLDVGASWTRHFWRSGSLYAVAGPNLFRVVSAVPDTPPSFRATASSGRVTLTWAASTDAFSYTILRGTSPGALTTLATGIQALTYTDTTVVDGNTYYYAVLADNGAGSSAASAQGVIRMGRPVPNDFDKDGKSDLPIVRTSTNSWLVKLSSTAYSDAGARETTVTSAADVPVAGDFDGDGAADVAMWTPATGLWRIKYSSDNYSDASATTTSWGQSGDVPLVADFDGDRRSDLAVYRPSDGTWRILTSSDNYATGTALSYPWGLAGDQPIAADFDGDGKTELTVFRPSTGNWYVRFSASGYGFADFGSYQWGLPGDVPLVTDFDGDGKHDLTVFRPGDGTWYVNLSSSSFTTFANYQWGLSSDVPVPGDFDGDAKTDLAVWRPSSGEWFIRFSSSGYSYATFASYTLGTSADSPIVGSGRRLSAPGNFRGAITSNGLGVLLTWTADPQASSYVVKRGTQPGNEQVLAAGVGTNSYTDSAVTANTSYYYVVAAVDALGPGADSAEIVIRFGPAVPGDMTGDGKADLTVYRPTTGQWFTRPAGAGATTMPGTSGTNETPVAGDFDGDGRGDIATFSSATGVWTLKLSSENFATAYPYSFGASGDVPLAGDFDGDRRSDMVIYRPSTGAWTVRLSSTFFVMSNAYQWGLAGDTPVSADFDGDSKADLVVYRPTTGEWFVRFSSSQYSFANWQAYGWGLQGDVPIATDFDGDGKADIAVWRPSDATWYVLFSSQQYSYAAWQGYQWGTSGDVAVPADYDGDGKTDLVVWRPSSGTWYVRWSADGYSYATWSAFVLGQAGDLPVRR